MKYVPNLRGYYFDEDLNLEGRCDIKEMKESRVGRKEYYIGFKDEKKNSKIDKFVHDYQMYLED